MSATQHHIQRTANIAIIGGSIGMSCADELARQSKLRISNTILQTRVI